MLFRRAGYLKLDNRVSGGSLFESNVLTCAHCPTQVIMNPLRTRERHQCRKCMQYLCDNPACHFECTPYEKQIDQLYERAVRSQGAN